MDELKAAIVSLSGQEADRAKQRYGAAYASHNEGFGVLAEEIQETADEVKRVEQYAGQLLRYVRCGDVGGMAEALRATRQAAIRAAMEAVQVAAVCEKWLESL